ncbi:MAG TPA: oligosaccharide flippase family protein [Patescibacteria group bacterium]|nr:oligosaccharide flippase family protein [Patescibacteria group bacterium]
MNYFKNQISKLWTRGAFHIFIGSFLSKFIAFFGSIFLVRVLSKNSYGILSYIENIYGYIYIFAGLGLGNALLRYVILGKTIEEKYGYYKYSIKTSTLFNIILAFIIFIGSLYYPHPYEFESAKWLLSLIVLAIPFHYLITSNSLAYRAMIDNKKYAYVTFITSVTLIVGRYIGAILFGLNGVIVAKIIINVFFGILLCYLIYKSYFMNVNPYTLDKYVKKTVNRYSIQYMITNGIWTIFMLNDVFMLSFLTGSASIVADYKVAYVLPANISIISSAIGVFIGPYFVQHENDKRWVWQNYKKTLLANIGLISPAVMIMFIFANPIITILFGQQYQNVSNIMRLLIISAFVNSGFRYISAHLLSSMGEIKYNMIISFLGVIFQIAINFIAIPIYGSIGAAFTSIVVYMFMALALSVVFIRKYKFSS